MPRTITLNLDLHTARLVRDALSSRARFYGELTSGHEHCEALKQFLDEEIQGVLTELRESGRTAGIGVRSGNC